MQNARKKRFIKIKNEKKKGTVIIYTDRNISKPFIVLVLAALF